MDTFNLVFVAVGIAGLAFLYIGTRKSSSITDLALAARGPALPVDKVTEHAIKALQEALPGQVLLPADKAFAQQIASHWSALQQEVIPAAIALPQSTAEVAIAIRILSGAATKSPTFRFAIRSGGHSPNTESNIANGIVLDLKHLNFIRLSADKTTADIGPSARWGQVYDALARDNRAVVGGRATTVGVAGLTLGGGISFFSGRRGFVCDGVLEQELVTAAGDVLICNPKQNTDLHVALKGGGNNFGIVTRFTFRAFEHGPELWGGNTYGWPGVRSCHRYLDGLMKMTEPAQPDLDSSCIMAFGHLNMLGGIVMPFTTCVNTAVTSEPESLKPITTLPYLYTMRKKQSLSAMCHQVEDSAPPGTRAQWCTTTFERDNEMLHDAWEIWRTQFPRAKKIKDMIWCIVFQPLYPNVTRHADTNGLGIETDKTLIVVSVNSTWTRREDDEEVFSMIREVTQQIEDLAQQRTLFNKFKYVNYSAWWQQSLRGVRGDKAELMHKLSHKVDPEGIFQRACVGGKKLP